MNNIDYIMFSYCILLRCVALHCVALRCVALRSVALRCVELSLYIFVLKRKRIVSYKKPSDFTFFRRAILLPLGPLRLFVFFSIVLDLVNAGKKKEEGRYGFLSAM